MLEGMKGSKLLDVNGDIYGNIYSYGHSKRIHKANIFSRESAIGVEYNKHIIF